MVVGDTELAKLLFGCDSDLGVSGYSRELGRNARGMVTIRI